MQPTVYADEIPILCRTYIKTSTLWTADGTKVSTTVNRRICSSFSSLFLQLIIYPCCVVIKNE